MNNRYVEYRDEKRHQLKREKNKKRLSIVLGIAVLLFASIASMPAFGRISPGVRYQGIRLGGMTPEAAKEKIERAQEKFYDETVVLTHKDKKKNVSASQLGLSLMPEKAAKDAMDLSREASIGERVGMFFKAKSVETPLNVDRATLSRTLEHLNGELYRGAKPAAVVMKDGQVSIERASAGEAVDAVSAGDELSRGIEDPVEIKTTPVEPSVSDEELRGIDAMFAQWSTTYDEKDKNRAVNVKRGASFFNRVVLAPGERLSFLETIGGITPENGFAEGETIVDGVESTGVGGGVCQVSTTMYNATVRAGMTILSKHNHSKPVEYAAEGTDCAVSDGYKDFIISNPYNTPVYIETTAKDGKLSCTVYGAGAEKPYVIDLEAQKIATLPAREEREFSPELKPREVRRVREKVDGSIYRTYKTYTQDGKVVKREWCATSRYVPVNGQSLVGVSD
ncbi:MAG: VanW family protein [Peptoniphilus sp.]|nr:VanW family protein [Peptoniphilus sp.]MDD7363612.1 VanW family protein [Bacillota bacterium]MDY6045197.1 VanW family protein [Peptoniphilus sp.]